MIGGPPLPAEASGGLGLGRKGLDPLRKLRGKALLLLTGRENIREADTERGLEARTWSEALLLHYCSYYYNNNNNSNNSNNNNDDNNNDNNKNKNKNKNNNNNNNDNTNNKLKRKT